MKKKIEELFAMDEMELARYSREESKAEWRLTQAQNARLALAAWDPNANLARKLAEREKVRIDARIALYNSIMS